VVISNVPTMVTSEKRGEGAPELGLEGECRHQREDLTFLLIFFLKSNSSQGGAATYVSLDTQGGERGALGRHTPSPPGPIPSVSSMQNKVHEMRHAPSFPMVKRIESNSQR